MRWETHPKGSTVGYTGYAESTPFAAATVQLLEKYIEDAAPKNAEITWDHLRVEIWLDSGRVILFPTPSPFRHRVENAVCQIICPDLLASYEDRIESGVPDDEFDTWATQAIAEVANQVSKAANEARLPERLGRPAVKIRYYSYGGDSGCIKEDVIRQEMNK